MSDASGTAQGLAQACQALGAERRVRVLRLLLEAPDTLCGCELSDVLDIPDYQVSRDLAALRRAGLVRDHGRTGTWRHYEAARGTDAQTDAVLDLVATTPLSEREAERFSRRYGLREAAGCVLGPGDPQVLAVLDDASA